MGINHENHLTWQAQLLVTLEGDAYCSAHFKWGFICDGHPSWESFNVAGAVFGDLGASLFVAGAVFGQIGVDSRGVKCRKFQYKMRPRSVKSNLGERAGARWRVHGRIINAVLRGGGPPPRARNVIKYISRRTHVHKCKLFHFLWAGVCKCHDFFLGSTFFAVMERHNLCRVCKISKGVTHQNCWKFRQVWSVPPSRKYNMGSLPWDGRRKEGERCIFWGAG